MPSGPSKFAEAIVAILVPPACREEVLGDLHERFTSPRQYALDAICTVPLVIMSRIRRTLDPQVLLIQAFALYLSFLGAAWLTDRTLLGKQWGLLRLAIPPAIVILGLILDDAYTHPGRRSALKPARGPLLGLLLALVSQEILRVGNSDLALPRWIAFYGCAMSLLLSCAVRICFPPVTGQLQGAHAPAAWLKQAAGSPGNLRGDVRFFKGIFAIVTVAIVGTWMMARAPSPERAMLPILLVLLVAYLVWRRGYRRKD